MSKHLQLKVNIFDAVEPVLVRPSVTVDRLFQDILREFSAELDLHQQYILLCNGRVLPPNEAIGSLGLPEDAVLTVSYREAGQAAWTAAAHTVSLQEQPPQIRLLELHEGRTFIVEKLPALIGRYSVRSAEAVDVDLSDLSEGDTVSRRHARLSFDGTRLAITRLEKANRLTLNGADVAAGETHPLADGDVLGFGQVTFRVEILTSEVT
jgi:hypothetical protein